MEKGGKDEILSLHGCNRNVIVRCYSDMAAQIAIEAEVFTQSHLIKKNR